MSARAGKFAVIGLVLAVALKLFSYGLSVPLSLRLSGDPYAYMAIANGFPSFASAFAYVGERTAGMPLFDYATLRLLHLGGPVSVQAWADFTCIVLLALHLCTAWIFSRWLVRSAVLKSEVAAYGLFAFLATFPALVGHLSTPLSDVLAIDLIVLAVVLLARSLTCGAGRLAVAGAFAAGALLGFSILVRSGSLPGLVFALAVAGALAYPVRRQAGLIAAAAIGMVVLLLPFWTACARQSGTVCLQTPPFPAVISAQAGLSGVRTLWTLPSTGPNPLPTLHDDFMARTYAQRCRLETMVGTGESSLTGCLALRPLALPAFVFKKWVGLFDHFRFTPQTERHTPPWLRWSSRFYSVLAWVGFALCLALAAATARRTPARSSQPLSAPRIALTILAVYSAGTLGVHTLLHVEERYSFPLLPLCGVALAACCEKAVAWARAGRQRRVALLAFYCAAAVAAFLAQVLAWDRTMAA